jgi:hypothetical protein
MKTESPRIAHTQTAPIERNRHRSDGEYPKKTITITILALLLTGCAVSSQIEKASESQSHFKNAFYTGHDFYRAKEKIDGERYRVFEQAATGLSGTSGIRQDAMDRANDFCRSKDPKTEMLTVSEHTAIPPYIFGNFPRIEIIFVCAVPANTID